THGNLFHTMSRRQFDEALDELESSLDGATNDQVKVGIMRVVAMVHDGHTRVRPESLRNHALPVRLHFFPDGLYVVAADRAHADLAGGRVTAIGLKSAAEAYGAVRPLIPVDADNEGRRRFLATDFLVMPEVLQAIGAAKGSDSVDITVDKGGRSMTDTLSAQSSAPPNDRPWPREPDGWVSAREHPANPLPLWARHADKHYWHMFVGGTRALYVQYNQVQDEPGG